MKINITVITRMSVTNINIITHYDKVRVYEKSVVENNVRLVWLQLQHSWYTVPELTPSLRFLPARRSAYRGLCCRTVSRLVFVGGGSRGTSPSLDLTFPPTGLSENVGRMERGRWGKGEREGWGRPPALLPPPHWLLPQIPAWRCPSVRPSHAA